MTLLLLFRPPFSHVGLLGPMAAYGEGTVYSSAFVKFVWLETFRTSYKFDVRELAFSIIRTRYVNLP